MIADSDERRKVAISSARDAVVSGVMRRVIKGEGGALDRFVDDALSVLWWESAEAVYGACPTEEVFRALVGMGIYQANAERVPVAPCLEWAATLAEKAVERAVAEVSAAFKNNPAPWESALVHIVTISGRQVCVELGLPIGWGTAFIAKDEAAPRLAAEIMKAIAPEVKP